MAADTMFSIRKTQPAAGLSAVGRNPVPPVGDSDVMIRVTHAGICGTDRHIYDWDEWSADRVSPPLTVGHEFAGVVAGFGQQVEDVSVGTRVSGEGHISCGVCRLCRNGRSHICERVQVIGIDCDGAFAEFLVLPRSNLWPLSDHITSRVAAVMDPLGNAMHTVTAANVSGRTVLISGAGVIGLMSVAIARQSGASLIIVTDVLDHHLELAGSLGADHMLRADDPQWAEQARSLTPRREGAEVWLEMSGATEALRKGFEALSNGGTAALLGLPRRPVELDVANSVITKGATLLGISGRLMYETWYQMERFLSRPQNAEAIESLITHEFVGASFEEAFTTLANGDAVKVLLSFSEV